MSSWPHSYFYKIYIVPYSQASCTYFFGLNTSTIATTHMPTFCIYESALVDGQITTSSLVCDKIYKRP